MSNLLDVINRYSDRPVYRQLSDLLEARLAEQARPGDRLPSEAELSQQFDVNRLTVRRALDELNQRGLIETVHGKGSFVATPVVRYSISAGRDASLTHAMRELGHDVAIRLLSAERVGSESLRTELGTAGDVLVCKTLRMVDEQPWSYSTTSIGVERFPGLEQNWSGETSLFDFLLDVHGVRMRRAHRTFTAGLAEPVEAEHLKIRVGAPVLEMHGLNIDQDGAPVALVAHRFRGDRVQFTVDLL
ncbi:HTH-type transcriptional repressor DasR [Mycolicibacterium vanbaalenii]|uniref:HTH-type transcriptional repressor DasR n=1 Tax=Mycolicibacterium vanbaalenii TaxID=110539 RepID=A0A5S9QV03_MYCVN|nr:GntR family transcriptional regulator [Mycolicibacterium vanbaalenii]CAA0123673.1 HTH-type transcriptional repressor DasR [Mycolicibacterium vanbaalenii]